MGRKIAGKLTIALLSASIVVPMFDCFSVGAADTVSLQCGVNTFMAEDLHPVFFVEPVSGEATNDASEGDASEAVEVSSDLENIVAAEPVEVVSVPSSEESSSETDEFEELLNTYTFTIEVSEDTEAIDESLFSYDGSEVVVDVDIANLRMEPCTESEIFQTFDRGSTFVRISYGTDWSRVRTEDGVEGYILSSLISVIDENIEDQTAEDIDEDDENDQDDIFDDSEETSGTSETSAETVETTAETTIETTVETTAETTAATTAATTAETTAETSAETYPADTTETSSEYTAAPVTSYTETECVMTVYAACVLNIRTGAGVDYDMVRVLQAGEQIDVVAQTSNGWYRTALGNYVKADLTTDQAPATPTPVPAADTSSSNSDYVSTSEASSGSSDTYSGFASYCRQFLGTRYEYAGSSPSGFDCSGYVSYVFANYYGISLPHEAAAIATMGSPVSTDNMQCGDVLCHDYNGDGAVDHVSIYIGNGTYIHASNSMNGVIETNYAGAITTVRRFI